MRCLLLMLASALPSAAEPDAVWQEAVALFDRGKASLDRNEDAKALFAQSAAKFAELKKAGIRHPALYRNLGNACYLADRLPEAILAYRQGLSLAPSDASMRDALEIARAQVVRVDDSHGAVEAETWPAWLPWPGFRTLLAMCVFAWTAACATAWIAWRRRRVAIMFVAAGFLALAIVSGMIWKSRADLAAADNLIVIRDDALALRRGNGPHYPAHPNLPVLRRGMEARRIHERGSWMQIRFDGGEIGWVPRDAVVSTSP